MNLQHFKAWRDGGAVKRLHTVRTIRQQTVAEHSHGVACLILLLEPSPSVNLLSAALTHDLGEVATGDVPAPTKWANPHLEQILKNLEGAWCIDMGAGPWSLTETEKQVLKFCDMAELLLFCGEEMQMGNQLVEDIADRAYNWLRTNCPTHGNFASFLRELLDERE